MREVLEMLGKPPAIYVLLLFGGWWIFVIISGSALPGVGHWDFTATGQLGDSFGIISAFMTSMAAIFTYQTLRDTRAQAKKAFEDAEAQAEESREQIRRMEEREIARSETDRKRDLEQTYYRLLELRFRALADISVQGALGGSPHVGTDGAKHLVDYIRNYNNSRPSTSHRTDEELFSVVYARNSNDLGHYFRFTYHIVCYAVEKFEEEAYDYLRILRAQLANAEWVLIALNCSYGHGREKFKFLVEKYALLHNVDEEDISRFCLKTHFRPEAFGRTDL